MLGGATDEELRNAQICIFCAIVYLFTGWIAWSELEYFVWGETVVAEIQRIAGTYTIDRRGRHIPKILVEFSFTDAGGTERVERETVRSDWKAPPGGRTMIEYFEGVPNSARILGVTLKLPVWIFLAMTLAAAIFMIRLWRHASKMVNGKPGRRRKKNRQ